LHFLFIIEDLDKDGTTRVRPHAHGVISMPHIDLASVGNGRTRRANERMIARLGEEAARFVRGRQAITMALKAATGNTRKRPLVFNGINQSSNIWTKRSYGPLFNKEAISYAYKNVAAPSSGLPENRIAQSQALITEARRLWELIRTGEPAMSLWD